MTTAEAEAFVVAAHSRLEFCRLSGEIMVDGERWIVGFVQGAPSKIEQRQPGGRLANPRAPVARSNSTAASTGSFGVLTGTGSARSSRAMLISRSMALTPSSPVALTCLSAKMVCRNSSSAFATSRLVAESALVLAAGLGEQRADVLLEHGECGVSELGFELGHLRHQDCGTARRVRGR